MPTPYYEVQTVELKNLKSEYVNITDSDIPFEIKNKLGKTVFYVDQNGANIDTMESTTSFLTLKDTPNAFGEEYSVAVVKNGKIEFEKILNVDSLKTKNIDVEECKINKSNVKELVVNDAVFENSNVKKSSIKVLDADDITSKNIITNKIVTKEFIMDNCEIYDLMTKTITSTSIKTDNINCDAANLTSIINDNLKSKNIDFENLKGENMEIKNIKCEKLFLKDGLIDYCAIDNLDVENIKCNNLQLPKYKEYGTIEEPLFLAISRTKRLLVEGENLKIITKSPIDIKEQVFFIDGIDHELDYELSVVINKNNFVYSSLVNDGKCLKVQLRYDKLTEADTIVKIYIKKIN